MPPQPQRGGPRQRILPTPRGVNMIVWSLDNRFVLAAIMGKLFLFFFSSIHTIFAFLFVHVFTLLLYLFHVPVTLDDMIFC